MDEAADRWDELVASGMSPDEATRIVEQEFGPPPAADAGQEDLANRWDELVAGGMDPDEATRIVEQEFASTGDDAAAPAGSPRLRDVGRAAAQGLSLGLSDEAIAGMRAIAQSLAEGDLGGFGERFGEAVGEERGALESLRETHPGVALGAELGGAAVPVIAGTVLTGGAGAIPALGRLAPTAARVGRLSGSLRGGLPAIARAPVAGAASGAATGAVQGAGTAEGGIEERLRGAAGGAGMGALTGGAFAAGGRAVQSAFRPTRQRAAVRLGGAAEEPVAGRSFGETFETLTTPAGRASRSAQAREIAPSLVRRGATPGGFESFVENIPLPLVPRAGSALTAPTRAGRRFLRDETEDGANMAIVTELLNREQRRRQRELGQLFGLGAAGGTVAEAGPDAPPVEPIQLELRY